MKKTLEAWQWSLGLLARSPMAVLGLAVLSALWGLAAYEWLSLPEASVWMLLLSLIWALAQVLIAVSVLAGSAASAGEAAAFGSAPRIGLTFITFNRTLLARTALFALPAGFLVWVTATITGWLDAHSLDVASFLTFHSEKPVSYIVVGDIFWGIESLLWIAVSGFLLTLLIILLRAGWREALRQATRTLANCFWRASFLTSFVGVAMFGGLSYLLVNWHPKVTPGSWDYTQMVARMGVALLLLVGGWFFILLSLARLNPRKDLDAHS
jgi:hypothetical protein